MANVVGGFLVPHDPLIYTAPNAPSARQKGAVHSAFTQVAARIGELDADTIIIIGSDHYILFGPSCVPSMLIAIGDVDGPLERFPGLTRGEIANNQPLAQHIFETGCNDGFDWAVAKAITVDHAIAIPYELCVKPNRGTKMIPVYLNSGVDPKIKLTRARAVGDHIGRSVRAWSGGERVVVIGSGGISHWVGSADMGKVNPDFDKRILACVETADIDTLCGFDDDFLLREAGNGAYEIRNFVCAMAAVAPSSGRTIAYEAVPEWITGLGFAELRVGT